MSELACVKSKECMPFSRKVEKGKECHNPTHTLNKIMKRKQCHGRIDKNSPFYYKKIFICKFDIFKLKYNFA
jgi:hypothetical protein